MLEVRENEITAQIVWWYCAITHLRGYIMRKWYNVLVWMCWHRHAL